MDHGQEEGAQGAGGQTRDREGQANQEEVPGQVSLAASPFLDSTGVR